MPYKEREIERLYWTIGEVADQFNVNTSLLRYWEREFPSLKPDRRTKGGRQYSKKDIEEIRVIHHLVKEKGFTINGAKEKLKTDKSGIETETELKRRLLNVKQLLMEVRKKL